MALSAATSWPGTRGAAQRAGPEPRAALGWRGGLWSPRPPYPGDGLNGGWRAASPYTEPGAGGEGRARGWRGSLARLQLLLPGLPPLLRRGARVEAGGLGPRTLAAWSRVGAHSPPRPAPARPPRPPPRPGRGPRPALPGGGGGEEEPPGALGRSRASLRAGERAAGRAEIHGGSAGRARGSARRGWSSGLRSRWASLAEWGSGEHCPLLLFPLPPPRPSRGRSLHSGCPRSGLARGLFPKTRADASSLSGRSFQPDQEGNPKGR